MKYGNLNEIDRCLCDSGVHVSSQDNSGTLIVNRENIRGGAEKTNDMTTTFETEGLQKAGGPPLHFKVADCLAREIY